MRMSLRAPLRPALAAAAAVLAAMLPLVAFTPAAGADEGNPRATRLPPPYVQECGACHLAYPPGLLPPASWQRLMGGLDRHFGSDASLDADTVRRLSDWLAAESAGRRRVQDTPPQDRITRSAWFVREHRKVPEVVWALPSVRSRAHCAACHTGADRGDFDEDHLRLPAGADPRLGRHLD